MAKAANNLAQTPTGGYRIKTETYGFAEARSNFSELFNNVALKGQIVKVTKRGVSEEICLVPRSILAKQGNVVREKVDLQKEIARLVAEHLLHGAPDHFIDSQLADLKDLEFSELIALADAQMPLSSKNRKALVKLLGERFVSRLEKRYEITKMVKDAEDEGLFDQIENQANSVNL